MSKSSYPLRLQTSLLEEVRRVAEKEGASVNQFIDVAVAEKLSALRTEDYFRERAARADVPAALACWGGSAPSRRARATRWRPRTGARTAAGCGWRRMGAGTRRTHTRRGGGR